MRRDPGAKVARIVLNFGVLQFRWKPATRHYLPRGLRTGLNVLLLILRQEAIAYVVRVPVLSLPAAIST